MQEGERIGKFWVSKIMVKYAEFQIYKVWEENVQRPRSSQVLLVQ